jgi:surface protein
MFYKANAFNQPLGKWDVSKVRDMFRMLDSATSFNQPLLADWDVSSVMHMDGMFAEVTSFNQPLADWDVSSGPTMDGQFYSNGCPGVEGEESCFYV